MEWLLAAAAGGAGGLFSYNRENFFFDKELYLKRMFQNQGMRIKQFELYREDVRDLVGLTVRKMDNYLIVNTLQLGFVITLIAEGRPVAEHAEKPGGELKGCPLWLVCLYMLCSVGAFLYYLLSIWLAMHASVAAHSFGVRLLTLLVRLPVPNDAELDRARALAEEYEGLGVKDMFRIPVWKQQLQKLNAAMNASTDEAGDVSDMGSEAGADVNGMSPVAMLQHVRQYRQLQANWQSYDAYARVCMAMGTNQLMHALSYGVLGALIDNNRGVIPAIMSVVIFTTSAYVIANLDLHLSRKILSAAWALLILPPTLTALTLWAENKKLPPLWLPKDIIPGIFLIHLVWVLFTIYIARASDFDQVKLPTKFRSVLYLDVFGWLSEPDAAGDPEHMGDVTTAESAGRFLPTLSMVTEEGAMSSMHAQTEPRALPENLRPVWLAECRRLQESLRLELEAWEHPNTQHFLQHVDKALPRQIRHYREEFDTIVAELDGAMVLEGSSLEPTLSVQQRREQADCIWLMLQWQPMSAAPQDLYYHPATDKNTFELPKVGPNRPLVHVSHWRDLSPNLVEFSNKVRTFATLRLQASLGSPSGEAENREPSFGRLFRRSGSPPPSPPPSPEPRRSVSAGGLTAATSGLGSPGPEVVQGLNRARMSSFGKADDSMSEESALRFGGEEAIRLENLPNRSQPFFAHSGAAASTFHPRPAAEMRRERVVRQKPGELPWYTVLQGSLVLVGVWTLGFGWSLFRVVTNLTIDLEPDVSPDHGPEVLTEPVSSPWPHPLLLPESLVCHDGLGPVALVAGRYGVHPLNLESPSSSAASSQGAPETRAKTVRAEAALEGCLESAKGFQSRGLAGIGLHCAEESWGGSSCSTVALAVDGRSAVRCRLDAEGVKPERLRLLGGPWRALAAAQEPEALWALSASGVATLLRPLRLPRSPPLSAGPEVLELSPAFDLPEQVGEGRLHVAGSGALLHLSPQGLLSAWSPHGGLPHRWNVSKPNEVRWAGLCSTSDSLYFAGVHASRTSGLWRARLPLELRQQEALSG